MFQMSVKRGSETENHKKYTFPFRLKNWHMMEEKAPCRHIVHVSCSLDIVGK